MIARQDGARHSSHVKLQHIRVLTKDWTFPGQNGMFLSAPETRPGVGRSHASLKTKIYYVRSSAKLGQRSVANEMMNHIVTMKNEFQPHQKPQVVFSRPEVNVFLSLSIEIIEIV